MTLGVLSLISVVMWVLFGGERNGGGCGGCLLVLIVVLGIGSLIVAALPIIGIVFGVLVVVGMLKIMFS